MPMPVMTLANATATGDMIVGPGALTTMVKGLPVACLGDRILVIRYLPTGSSVGGIAPGS